MEAHAIDEWPIGNVPEAMNLVQHTCLAERMTAASAFVETFKPHPLMRILVDGMDNSFNSLYSSWPARSWIVHEGEVKFKSMPLNIGNILGLDEMAAWLNNWLDYEVSDSDAGDTMVSSEITKKRKNCIVS